MLNAFCVKLFIVLRVLTRKFPSIKSPRRSDSTFMHVATLRVDLDSPRESSASTFYPPICLSVFLSVPVKWVKGKKLENITSVDPDMFQIS
jgi:hypothetical protein